jgi:hypothetical protein
MASAPSESSGYGTAESCGHLDIPPQQNSLIVAASGGREAEVQLLLGRQDVIPDFKSGGYTALWWRHMVGRKG